MTLAAGCGFYFGDDDDDPCQYLGDSPTRDIASAGQRNPETGMCEYFDYPYPCDGVCGPCPAATEDSGDSAIATPTWGFCESQCTGLAKDACLEATGCRAIYVPDPIDDGPPQFAECWSTDQVPTHGGSCEGLDAYSCSRRDDCSALHENVCQTDPMTDPKPIACPGAFVQCRNEDETTDPGDAGLCYAPVTCAISSPACPAGTTPGILDGCYTGYCIPLADCESQPACSAITVEMTCIARTDCTPLYVGVDCMCNSGGCTCASWDFASCSDGS